MWRRFSKVLFRRSSVGSHEIDPAEILLDASNLPGFDTSQFEGRLQQPIKRRVMYALGIVFSIIAILYAAKLFDLQIVNGETYALRSEQNRLTQRILFPERGVIQDRMGEKLVTNTRRIGSDFAKRVYTTRAGFGHLLGYVSYPQKDSSGNYFQTEYVGKEGVEMAYESLISGVPGMSLVETDALGAVQSQNVVQSAIPGTTLTVTIDARIQEKLYTSIEALTAQVGFQGGAGAIMDIHTGELLAVTSFPEFNSGILSEGEPKEKIAEYVTDKRKPFLNRPLSGLYTPGSIMKPYVAIGALEEGVIDPLTNILSTGSISIPNVYTPSEPTIFRDWKAHGYVDMRKALAVSSNVYFFEVGGGYQNQKGLGIERLNTYFKMFGFGTVTGVVFGEEEAGTVPSIEWKEKVFPDEPWRIGDTYNTSIGQYGFQVTPMQAVRAIAAVANGGRLLTPHVVAEDHGVSQDLPVDSANLEVIREGMRQGVLEGTGKGLFFPELAVASKSGTAELDFGKKYVNSWISGFFPYEKPRFAFVVVMEQGPRTNTIGGLFVMRQVLEYMIRETPEYVK